jgi:hypothetical protein
LQDQLIYIRRLTQSSIDQFEELKPYDDGFPSQLLDLCGINDEFSSLFENMTFYLSTIINGVSNESLPTEDENVPNDNFVTYISLNEFQQTSDNLRKALSTTSNCLLQYKLELDNMASWLNEAIDQLSATIDTSQMIPANSDLNAFQTNATYLEAQYGRFVAGKMSLYTLAKNIFNSSLYGNVLDCATSLSSSIDSSVFSQLTSVVNSESSTLNQLYSLLLPKFANLQKYLYYNDYTIEKSLRSYSIWRKPVVNQQKADVSKSLVWSIGLTIIFQVLFIVSNSTLCMLCEQVLCIV